MFTPWRLPFTSAALAGSALRPERNARRIVHHPERETPAALLPGARQVSASARFSPSVFTSPTLNHSRWTEISRLKISVLRYWKPILRRPPQTSPHLPKPSFRQWWYCSPVFWPEDRFSPIWEYGDEQYLVSRASHNSVMENLWVCLNCNSFDISVSLLCICDVCVCDVCIYVSVMCASVSPWSVPLCIGTARLAGCVYLCIRISVSMMCVCVSVMCVSAYLWYVYLCICISVYLSCVYLRICHVCIYISAYLCICHVYLRICDVCVYVSAYLCICDVCICLSVICVSMYLHICVSVMCVSVYWYYQTSQLPSWLIVRV